MGESYPASHVPESCSRPDPISRDPLHRNVHVAWTRMGRRDVDIGLGMRILGGLRRRKRVVGRWLAWLRIIFGSSPRPEGQPGPSLPARNIYSLCAYSPPPQPSHKQLNTPQTSGKSGVDKEARQLRLSRPSGGAAKLQNLRVYTRGHFLNLWYHYYRGFQYGVHDK